MLACSTDLGARSRSAASLRKAHRRSGRASIANGAHGCHAAAGQQNNFMPTKAASKPPNSMARQNRGSSADTVQAGEHTNWHLWGKSATRQLKQLLRPAAPDVGPAERMSPRLAPASNAAAEAEAERLASEEGLALIRSSGVSGFRWSHLTGDLSARRVHTVQS